MRTVFCITALLMLVGCQSVPGGQEPKECTQKAPTSHLVEGESLAIDHPQLTLMLAARGDLDGDGIEEVADVVVHQPGGSGSFYYLSVNKGLSCGFAPMPAVFLGDRIALDAMEVTGQRLTVTFRDRDESEPMVSPPTRLNRWRFLLEEGELKRLER